MSGKKKIEICEGTDEALYAMKALGEWRGITSFI